MRDVMISKWDDYFRWLFDFIDRLPPGPVRNVYGWHLGLACQSANAGDAYDPEDMVYVLDDAQEAERSGESSYPDYPFGPPHSYPNGDRPGPDS